MKLQATITTENGKLIVIKDVKPADYGERDNIGVLITVDTELNFGDYSLVESILEDESKKILVEEL